MKAAQITEYGDASVVKINDTDMPVAKPGQVVVEVHAASLNPFDTIVREGYLQQNVPLQLPATLGGDIAGVVTEAGEDVTDFTVGDKVYGQANIVAGNSGAFAEFAATSATQIAKMPENLGFTEAASLPLAGVSAIQALTEHIKLAVNQKIFINGGAGAIGSIAIQLAKNIGAYVATAATREGIELAKQLGADEVIDYKTNDFSALLKDYDAVFDTVGGDTFDKSLAILKKGGIAVSMAADADSALAAKLEVTAIHQMTHVTTGYLDTLRDLVEQGVITPRIGATFPLDQIAEAQRARESGEVLGKVAIRIK
ncbi:MAG: NADP-dependent oxidoreductase [Candidatus Saccharibacteria bacterium]|nr:MAG: NADP-dependent oxidoreductase [Candidatus Saccharibacteria bacterium]